MLFWIIAALLTIGASLAVLLPLARGAGRGADAGRRTTSKSIATSLRELDRDAARGLIGAAEAEEARAEIARRILKIAGTRTSGRPPARAAVGVARAGRRSRRCCRCRWSAGASTPRSARRDLPSQPLARAACRPIRPTSTVDELVARAEGASCRQSGRRPRLGRAGADLSAHGPRPPIPSRPTATRSGCSARTATARPASARRSPRRRRHRHGRRAGRFERGAATRAGSIRSRASSWRTALAQEGQIEEALAAWQRDAGGSARRTSPWRRPVEQALAEAGRRMAAAEGPPRPVRPPEEIDAAASMSPEDRNAMIETMVAGLDERLRQNPQRRGRLAAAGSFLCRAGQDRSRRATRSARARRRWTSGSEDGKRLQALAASLGLTATE